MGRSNAIMKESHMKDSWDHSSDSHMRVVV